MSKPTKSNSKEDATPVLARKRGARDVLTIASALAIGSVLGFGWWKVNHIDSPPAAPVAQAKSANRVGEVGQSTADFQKLKGKWVRPDGGYVVEVRSVDERGRIDASYSNPKPIHVAKAEASHDGTTVRVFIELRDINYPGSTYDLTYEPQSDALNGVYYQAALQQRFSVTFIRMR